MTDDRERLPVSLLTAEEVASILRVSLRTVRRFTAAGQLPVVRFGRSVRIDRADLDNFLRRDTK